MWQVGTEYSTGLRIKLPNRGGNNSAFWFIREQTTSTMKIPMTPGSELRNKIQESIKDVRGPDGGFTKIVEEAGTPVGLLVPGPTLPRSCQFTNKCLVGDQNCQTPNLVYEVTCTECPNLDPQSDPQAIYIGTTGANIHARSLAHKTDISGKKFTNSLYKHNLKFHAETHTELDRFQFKNLSTHSTVMNR